MSTNIYFNNFNNAAEQSLIEDLIIESIRVYGHDLWYCPRSLVNKDNVFGQDDLSEYNSSYQIEMYIKNVEGFEGEGEFLSKFNIQIRDEITFTVANKVYRESIGDYENNLRPQEGDIIYMPMSQKIYVIKQAIHEPVFYQMGALQSYDLKCEQWEYSSEKLNTGISYIDAFQEKYALAADINDGLQTDVNGNIIIDPDTGRPVGVPADWQILNPEDPFATNNEFQTKAVAFIDFSETDPFSDNGQY